MIAIAVSCVLLALVVWLADLGSIDLSATQPLYLFPAVLAYVTVLVLRGVLFRHLTKERGNAGLVTWIALAARHQFIFIVSPSGSGDLAFPVLANRMLGIGLGSATGLIAGTRLRDICAVFGLGCIGLSGVGFFPIMAVELAVLFGLALYFSDVTISYAGRLVATLRGSQPPDAAEVKPSRLPAAALTLLVWLVASGGVASGFAAAGHPLTIYETWVMLAGLNLAGAIAVSVAGLGIAEAGATGVLVFLGMPLAQAAAIAVVARPLLLLSNTGASALIEVVTRAMGRSTVSPDG
jgi:uncharacterized membrane protein YbhN (UPF0104 family)